MITIDPTPKPFDIGKDIPLSEQIQLGMIDRMNNILNNSKENYTDIMHDIQKLKMLVERLENQLQILEPSPDKNAKAFYKILYWIRTGIYIK